MDLLSLTLSLLGLSAVVAALMLTVTPWGRARAGRLLGFGERLWMNGRVIRAHRNRERRIAAARDTLMQLEQPRHHKPIRRLRGLRLYPDRLVGRGVDLDLTGLSTAVHVGGRLPNAHLTLYRSRRRVGYVCFAVNRFGVLGALLSVDERVVRSFAVAIDQAAERCEDAAAQRPARIAAARGALAQAQADHSNVEAAERRRLQRLAASRWQRQTVEVPQ